MGRSLHDDITRLLTYFGWIILGALSWLVADKLSTLAVAVRENAQMGYDNKEQISVLRDRTERSVDIFNFCAQIEKNQREDRERLFELEKSVGTQRR